MPKSSPAAHDNPNRAGALSFSYYKIAFRHFRDDETENALNKLIHSFRRVYNTQAALDSIMDKCMAKLRAQEYSVYLSILVSGTKVAAGSCTLATAMMKELVKEHMPRAILLSPSALSAAATATVLRCIGDCACIMGKELEPLLIDVLFPVLERLGDEDASVKRAAGATLKRFAHYCGHENVVSLLRGNADYVLDALLRRLAKLRLFPSSPRVVKAVMERLEFFDDVTGKLLSELSRAVLASLARQGSRGGNVLELLRVVLVLVTRHPVTCSVGMTQDEGPDAFAAWLAGSTFEPLLYDDERDDDASAEEGENAESNAVKDLDDLAMEACAYVSHPDWFVQNVALEIVRHALMRVPYKKVLNLLHRLWPALCARIHQSDGIRTNAALFASLLHTIIIGMGVSGDFLSHRMGALMPAISKQIQLFSQSLATPRNVSLLENALACVVVAQRLCPSSIVGSAAAELHSRASSVRSSAPSQLARSHAQCIADALKQIA